MGVTEAGEQTMLFSFFFQFLKKTYLFCRQRERERENE